MKCPEIQNALSLYADGFLAEGESSAIVAHLETCPLCRQTHAEIVENRSALRRLRRPEITAALRNSIKNNVRSQMIADKRSWVPIASDVREWLQMRIMPYTVGVTASVVVGFTFLTMMFSGMFYMPPQNSAARRGDTTVMLAANSDEITPSEYAQTRLGYASESPSVNPQGALIALTKSLVRGGMKDDEVVVVADVFGSGLAQIAEVVEPSRDRRAVAELQKALESNDPAYAAFVPAKMENRPENVRVVLKFQSVNVRTGL